MYVHTNTQLQRGSISCISYVSALGKMGLGPGTFKGIIFNWRWLHLCLWSRKMLGFLCLPLVFPGGCVGKWTKQKCRNLWLLWRQRQPRVRREKGEPTFFFPSGVQSSFVKTEKLLLPTQRTSWGLWGHPGCCCWQVTAPESCSATRTGAEHPLCSFPLKQDIEEWGVPNDGSCRAFGIHSPVHSPSWVPGALLCRAGMVACVTSVLLVLHGLTRGRGTWSAAPCTTGAWLQLLDSSHVCQLWV